MPSPSAKSSAHSQASTRSQPTQWKRSLISLALLVHLLCVLIAMAASYAPSRLQTRLAGTLRPYLRPLNFETAGIPYWLTHATENDVDVSVEALPEGADASDPSAWILLSDQGLPGSQVRWRFQRLGHQLLFFAEEESLAGAIAHRIAVQAYHEQAISVKRLRVMRHNLMQQEEAAATLADVRNPYNRAYYQVAYEANILRDDQGAIRVVKLDDKGQVARPRETQE